MTARALCATFAAARTGEAFDQREGEEFLSDRSVRVGLVLPGGGARGAYQAGVLKAVAEIRPAGSPNPFPIVSGTSAGAINAAVLASTALDLQAGVRSLCDTWAGFSVEQGVPQRRSRRSPAAVCARCWA